MQAGVRYGANSPGEMAFNHVFFYIYKVFWSFLHDFKPAESKSVECQTQKFEQFCADAKNQDGRQK